MASYEAFVAELGDWKEVLSDYLSKGSFKQVYEFVREEFESAGVPIYPPKHLVFNAFKHC